MTHKMHTRAASKPKSYDEEAHTIEMEVSTENPVHGVSLSHKRGAVDLSRFIGAPFLNAHKRGDVRDVLGKIIAARFEERKLIATVKLTRRADAAGIVQDIIDGMIPQTSVGFTVSEWGQDSVNPKTGARTRTATRWRPFEVSAVPYAADETRVRSEHANPGETWSKSMKKKAAGNPPAENVDVIDTPANENNVAETRAEIRDVFKRALPRDLERAYAEADAIIDADGTVEDANARALELMQERTANAPRVRVVNPGTSPADTMRRRQDALYARVTGTAPKDDAREFYNVRLVDHARAALAACNVSTVGMNEFDIITRAHTVSDYPLLLEGTGNRVLMEQFEAQQTPLMRLGRTATAPDFRTLNRLRISEMGALKPLAENGELQNVSRSEIADAYAIDSAGAIFSLSFRAQANDDLSAFADWGRAMAQQAAQYQKNKIVDLIQGNPNSEDNQPLFSAAHGNIATDASGVTVGGLSAARVAIRTQKGLDGVTTLNLRPQFLVVGAELETAAEQVLSEIAAATVDTANPFSGSLELLVESDLTPGDWYVFASPTAAPVFEHAWLQGYTGPQLASQENFRTLARDYRVVIHWGCGLLPGGWRGAYKNAGSEDSNSSFI